MKKHLLLSLFFLIITNLILSQSNDSFKYQAIIRDATGNIIANTGVDIEISILQGTTDGSIVFMETHTVVSNMFGLVNLNIGSQNTIDFAQIDWANGPYFVKIRIDGNDFGTSQLLSVPYALHAKTVANYNESDPLFLASPASEITQNDIFEWTNKIAEFTEVDPFFSTSVASQITQSQIDLWTNKLDEFIESDPVFSASLANGITATDTAYWNSKLDDFVESDPIFLAHPSATITADDIVRWKALFIWYTTNEKGYLIKEEDPVYLESQAANITSTDIENLSNLSGTNTGDQDLSGLATINSVNVALNQKVDKETGKGLAPDGATSGDMLYWSGSSWVKVEAPITDETVLTFCNGKPMWTESGTCPVPTLTTTAISSVAKYSATSGGNITNSAGFDITARGVCWNTSGTPTIADNKTSNGTGMGTFSSNMTGLSGTTTYYVRAYATNSAGTAYGPELSFTTYALAIGDVYGGGIVAYLFESGDPGYVNGELHGIIASSADLSSGIQWYNGTYTTTGATTWELGYGSANTTAIIASQGDTGSYAAKICRDYNGGGNTDWYLPSIHELKKLYDNRNTIGGFQTVHYWSSTENNSSEALTMIFATPAFYAKQKNVSCRVRAVRNF